VRTAQIGLLVTGRGEQEFLPDFLRAMASPGPEGSRCVFTVIRRIEQLTPRSSDSKKELKITGKGRRLPSRDEEIGLAARGFLTANQEAFVLLVDDLEYDRRPVAHLVFGRYRAALDGVLEDRGWRASVHFLVNMLEAYYFADPQAVKVVLGLELPDPDGDVEEIRHPKNELKRLLPGFDEVSHGKLLARKINLERVLIHPERCASLRSLVAWCTRALGRADGDRFQLLRGIQSDVTAGQRGHLQQAGSKQA
jgi:hypothetical protein